MTLGLLLEQSLRPQVGGLVVPEKVSLKAGYVIGVKNWSILIDAGKFGSTILFPVEQSAAATIVNKKLDTDGGTERKSESEHVIVTVDVPATSDVYRV
jgi:hypothetical protein